MLNRAGAQNSYNHSVRIGNWNEDKEIDELKMKEYLHKKANGQLLVNKVQAHLNASLQEVPLSYSSDGFVHIGDTLMLYNVATEGVLSIDTAQKINSYDVGFVATTSTLTQAPVARNTFVIEPVGDNVMAGDVLKLGQPFRLRVNPRLESQAYVISQPTSTSSFSKVSRNQEVSANLQPAAADTVWVAVYKDCNQRFEMEGQNVPTNAEIVIQHRATKSALASDKLNVYNDFGNEFEVCCRTAISLKKKQVCLQDKYGFTTSDIPVRPEESQNHWAFLSASVPPEAAAEPAPQQ
jgi:hypothetical protein